MLWPHLDPVYQYESLARAFDAPACLLVVARERGITHLFAAPGAIALLGEARCVVRRTGLFGACGPVATVVAEVLRAGRID